MTYTLIANSPYVTRDADGATIPNNANNPDWKVYQAWLALGNTPNPAPAPPPAPISPISMWQARVVLSQTPYDPSKAQAAYQGVVAGKTNLLDATNALIGAANNVTLATYWEYATQLDIEDSLLNQLGTELGLVADDVKALFTAAHGLTI